jgi:ribosomal protein S18 acetylase RimI-like enzyme
VEAFSEFSRLLTYHKRHGSLSTMRRVAVHLRRALLSNRTVLFYCDLDGQNTTRTVPLASSPTIERARRETEVDDRDLAEIIELWNPALARQNINQRFEKGASLWIIRSEGKLAGHGWSLRGGTIQPHYFPLGPDDAHLFDFVVFPRYRGRGLNPLLVGHILGALSAECRGGRAFIEVAEWNKSQLSSLEKTPFRRLGCARKCLVFRRTIVYWDENEAA